MPEPRNLAEYAAELTEIWGSGGDLDRFDERIESAVKRIVTRDLAPDVKGAKALLAMLRNATLFHDLQRIAESLASVDESGENPVWRRFYAQALIDTGALEAARYMLLDLAARLEPRDGAEPDDEWKEAVGLLGRVCKQRYVNSRPTPPMPFTERVQEAIRQYDRVYAKTHDFWHGVNVLALLDKQHRIEQRAARGTHPEARRVARAVLDSIPVDAVQDARFPWRVASRAEAHLGLGDDEAFVREMKSYASDAGVDRFMLRGTLRQLREVWDLDDDPTLARDVLDLMEQAIVRLAGGKLDRAYAGSDAAEGFERMQDGSPLVPADWLDKGRACKSAVCRVLGVDGVRFVGSGYAFDGKDLPGLLEPGTHVVTNAHVVAGGDERAPGAVSLDDAVFHFPKADGGRRIRGRDCSIVFSSPRDALDATIVRPKRGTKPLGCLLEVHPRVVTKEDHVLILGYPLDRELQLSMVNNRVIRAIREERYFHYLVSTDEGSSGSPVFDMGWNVVGVHHYGSAKERFNRGITWRAIAQALQSRPEAAPSVVKRVARKSKQKPAPKPAARKAKKKSSRGGR